MGKRRSKDNEEVDVEMEDEDVVNVDFDFFNFVEDDFLTIKNLLRQLFSLDSSKFDVSALAQLVLDSQRGSTVKVDDEEYNDVLAFIGLLNMDVANSAIRNLRDYWFERTGSSPSLNRALRRIFADDNRVGLILSERLLNMPYEVVPPLWALLRDELAESSDSWDYLIIPSRKYSEQEPAEDLRTDNAPQSSKRPKSVQPADDAQLWPFHPEDDAIAELARAKGSFSLESPPEETESRRAFQECGIYPYGYITVIDFSRFSEVVDRIQSLSVN